MKARIALILSIFLVILLIVNINATAPILPLYLTNNVTKQCTVGYPIGDLENWVVEEIISGKNPIALSFLANDKTFIEEVCNSGFFRASYLSRESYRVNTTFKEDINYSLSKNYQPYYFQSFLIAGNYRTGECGLPQKKDFPDTNASEDPQVSFFIHLDKESRIDKKYFSNYTFLNESYVKYCKNLGYEFVENAIIVEDKKENNIPLILVISIFLILIIVIFYKKLLNK